MTEIIRTTLYFMLWKKQMTEDNKLCTEKGVELLKVYIYLRKRNNIYETAVVRFHWWFQIWNLIVSYCRWTCMPERHFKDGRQVKWLALKGLWYYSAALSYTVVQELNKQLIWLENHVISCLSLFLFSLHTKSILVSSLNYGWTPDVTWTILPMSLLCFWTWEHFSCIAVYAGSESSQIL